MYVVPLSSNFDWEAIQFQSVFITQIGHRPGVSNSNCSEDETRTYKKHQGHIMTTLGPHYDTDATKAMPESY